MKEKDIAGLYRGHTLYDSVLKEITSPGDAGVRLEGLTGSSSALLAASLFVDMPVMHLTILPEKDDAAYFYNDLISILGEESVLFFPSTFRRSARYTQTDPANIVLRTGVLNHLTTGSGKKIVVTYPEALMEKVVSRKTLKKNTMGVRRGDNLSIEFIEEVLQEYNFSRVDFVYEPGQYSVRGSIVDLFSYATDKPFRLDFFGDSVESIRIFSPDDQLSDKVVNEISIIPNIQDISIEEVKDSFYDFMPAKSIVWIESPEFARERVNDIYFQAPEKDENGEPAHRAEQLITGNRLIGDLERFNLIVLGKKPLKPEEKVFRFATEPQPSFNKNFALLGGRLEQNSSEGYTNFIVSESVSQTERLSEIFSETNPNAAFTPVLVNLHGGFTDHELKVVVYTDHQIFDRYHKVKIRGYFTRKDSISLKELTGLNPGDYVVHIDHGIGRFGGLERIEVNGRVQEAIKLVYRDNDILFVGIHSLHRISKYKGKDAEDPRIHKLGSGAWQKLKQATKKKVKDIARDLILLYAKRISLPGKAFLPDSYLQRELEASFIYEDTPDQVSATAAVKKDMEADHPMDRLICGDVGFGKTEIAVRAAFKAATDGKQTAILVPTTILALQHFKTFSARLADFPCRVEYISRHRKPSDQKKILSDLAEGKIDIMIGTHRLAGTDVVFKDLGLLIIDEEQRFGVAVKEKIKKMKANVDTLTLTATPIPRTLQFSLMGARDLSIISTPPPNRVPIVTELHGFNEEIIKEGIDYEVNRNGQVFFIHNRVENIKDIQAAIGRICPDVKTGVVHGKMQGDEIENIMFDFIQGDFDVLIATTIIESGLDIPNANTIFINDAHHFGLSELHQLRGRVGRSNRKAFCYLITPPLTLLTHDARRRLLAIEEFSGLGSGFNIAMQDLDIRGAGNLLGGEQSGFIADIGFETYQRILNEAVLELREEQGDVQTFGAVETETKGPDRGYVADVQIDTDMEIMFSEDYISSIPERIRLYRELNEIAGEEELREFELKLTDRFGAIPGNAAALLEIVRLKWAASRLGMEKITLKNGIMIISFISESRSPFYRSASFVNLMNYINRRQNIMKMRQKENKLSLTVSNITTVAAAATILNEMCRSVAGNPQVC
jgi:transcription-repair coupling factor (superfamily II helicase)